MKFVRYMVAGVACLATSWVWAEVPEAAISADIIILGEIHDNPTHHAEQLTFIQALDPKAVVYEMLTKAEAHALADIPKDSGAIIAATSGFHWSNIADYAGLISASDVVVGAALPRESVRDAFSNGAAGVFGTDAALFGLLDALPPDQQAAREDLQFAAHCDAMPRNLMSGMVEAQRLRDAHFARVVLQSFETYGAPIVLITGNGHARKDWGVPAVLQVVRPDLTVFTLGQGEDSALAGGFDAVETAPAPERGDPCAAFR